MVTTHLKGWLLGAVCGVALPAQAASLTWNDGAVARCVAKTGEAALKQAGTSKPLEVKTPIRPGDTVTTGKSGAARLLMRDGSVLDLAADTSMVLQAYKQEGEKPTVRLKTLLGRLWAHVMPRPDTDFVVEGSNAVAGVRGTSFVIHVDAGGQTSITTATGSVNVKGSGGSANVGPLQQLLVKGKGPLNVVNITPQDLQNLRNSMHIGSSMDPTSGQKLVQNTQQQHASNAPPPPPPLPPPPGGVLDRGVPTTTLNTAPQLNINPGARLTHVHATIQLRP